MPPTPAPDQEPPIEDVLDEFVPEWREGNLTGEEVVALFKERAAKAIDGYLDTLNLLDGKG